jgi:hypothetical protein
MREERDGIRPRPRRPSRSRISTEIRQALASSGEARVSFRARPAGSSGSLPVRLSDGLVDLTRVALPVFLAQFPPKNFASCVAREGFD